MDVVAGDTTGRDALRSFLRASATITDAEIQACWDAAVDATARWIKPGYGTDAPQGVVEFVLNVASDVWRRRDSGGDLTVLPDGSINGGQLLTAARIRHHATVAGPYVTTPRVIA